VDQTNAERQARWRKRRKAKIAELEAQAARQPPSDDGLAAARIAELEKRIAELEATLATRPAAFSPKSAADWAARREQVREENRMKRAAARTLKAGRLAEAEPELTREELLVRLAERESQIKGLRTQLQNERRRLKQSLDRKLLLSKSDRKNLLACLHPDRVQDEAEKKRLTEAFTLVENLPYERD
jgi:hypothetical protein